MYSLFGSDIYSLHLAAMTAYLQSLQHPLKTGIPSVLRLQEYKVFELIEASPKNTEQEWEVAQHSIIWQHCENCNAPGQSFSTGLKARQCYPTPNNLTVLWIIIQIKVIAVQKSHKKLPQHAFNQIIRPCSHRVIICMPNAGPCLPRQGCTGVPRILVPAIPLLFLGTWPRLHGHSHCSQYDIHSSLSARPQNTATQMSYWDTAAVSMQLLRPNRQQWTGMHRAPVHP